MQRRLLRSTAVNGRISFLLVFIGVCCWFGGFVSAVDRHRMRMTHFLEASPTPNPSLSPGDSTGSNSQKISADPSQDSSATSEDQPPTLSPSPPSPSLSDSYTPTTSPIPSSSLPPPSPIISDPQPSTSPPEDNDGNTDVSAEDTQEEPINEEIGPPVIQIRPLQQHPIPPPINTAPPINKQTFAQESVDHVCIDSTCNGDGNSNSTTASASLDSNQNDTASTTATAPSLTPAYTIPPSYIGFRGRHMRRTPTPTPKVVYSMKITTW